MAMLNNQMVMSPCRYGPQVEISSSESGEGESQESA